MPPTEYGDWASKCTYKCKVCNDFSTQSYLKFRDHIVKNHGITISQYNANHGRGMVIKAFHRCKMCSQNVIWEIERLRVHMKKEHKLGMQEYYDKFIISRGKVKEEPIEEYQLGTTDADSVFMDWLRREVYECPVCKGCTSSQRCKAVELLINHL